MSSMDQAFVKAFARRKRSGHRPTGPGPAGNARSEGNDANQAPPDTATASAEASAEVSRAESKDVPPSNGPGSLQVDRSVAGTAQVWVDPIEDQIARADIAAHDVPKPHVDPTIPEPPKSAIDTADSLRNLHTAYASAVSDIPVLQVESASFVEPQPFAATVEGRSSQPQTDAKPVDRKPATSKVTEFRVDPPVSQSIEGPVFPFQAAWEVDVFDIPASVADLFFEGVLFQQIAERMSEAVATGLNSVLITSTKKGEGRSSVAIGIAMASAAAGIRVALVDADSEDPTLADDLRLDLQYGWVDTIRGGLPIKEAAVHAVEDGVTLIPLMPPHGQTAATAFEVVQLVKLLKEKFELVILDGPTGLSSSLHQCAAAVDSAIIVRDVTRSNTLAINEFSYRLRESGVKGVGVVENFV